MTPLLIERTYCEIDAQTTLRQIGALTVLAVSGGRVHATDDAVMLLCGQSRRVEVRLNALDLYDVFHIRTITRGARRGEQVVEFQSYNVHCEDLSEVVYRAGHWK